MPFVVGRKVKPDDGTTVVFEVAGDVGGTIALNMDGGRAYRMDAAPALPTVRLEHEPHGVQRAGRRTLVGAAGVGRRLGCHRRRPSAGGADSGGDELYDLTVSRLRNAGIDGSVRRP